MIFTIKQLPSVTFYSPHKYGCMFSQDMYVSFHLSKYQYIRMTLNVYFCCFSVISCFAIIKPLFTGGLYMPFCFCPDILCATDDTVSLTKCIAVSGPGFAELILKPFLMPSSYSISLFSRLYCGHKSF